MAEQSKTVVIKNFFTIELHDFDPERYKKAVDFGFSHTGYFHGPVLRAYDHHNHIERVAEFKIQLWNDSTDDWAGFHVNISPPVISQNLCLIVDDGEEEYIMDVNHTEVEGNFLKVILCVDVEVPVPGLKTSDVPWIHKIRQVLEKHFSNKFTIKCQDETVETLKLYLIASSPVFEAMFESGMKEAQENSMEITDFTFPVVKKMIEFCETDNIKNFEGKEFEVFQIAHKYQMQDLMDCALCHMMQTTTEENRSDRYYILAQMLSMDEYKKWWGKF